MNTWRTRLKAAREADLLGGTHGVGTTPLHRQLEAKVATFVGKEDAVVFNMGYGTNSTTYRIAGGAHRA